MHEYFKLNKRQPLTLKKKGVASNKKPLINGIKKKEAEQEEKQSRRRFRPGTVAIREIKKYQKYERLFLPRNPFQRLVKSIVQGINP